jgi:hypothetical protein
MLLFPYPMEPMLILRFVALGTLGAVDVPDIVDDRAAESCLGVDLSWSLLSSRRGFFPALTGGGGDGIGMRLEP